MATINLFPNDTVQVDTLVDANGGAVGGIPQKTYAELVALVDAANVTGSGSPEFIALDGTHMEVTSGAPSPHGKVAVLFADNQQGVMTAYAFYGEETVGSYSPMYPAPSNS